MQILVEGLFRYVCPLTFCYHQTFKCLKCILEIFKEESDEISSIPPTVFFEKNFWKFLENSQKNIRDRAHI